MYLLAVIAMVATFGACDDGDTRTITKVERDTVYLASADSNAARADTFGLPVTLPILDAMLADSAFALRVQQDLQIDSVTVDSLRLIARNAVDSLDQTVRTASYEGSTADAEARARQRIGALIGPEKTERLFGLVRTTWSSGGASDSTAARRLGTGGERNGVPSDTRIVINLPAYRMDLFRNGELVETYRVGIGYPEFPAPVGVRTAGEIIFNPTWTRPYEPWVPKEKRGKTVGAKEGSNPLGIAKIPIGLPSLIHAGKEQAQIGSFASHGCIGLTNEQMRRFAPALAELAGKRLGDSLMKSYTNADSTRTMSLGQSLPVELRYETIQVIDGRLHIFRDVYDYNTNTEGELKRVLARYGVSLDTLEPGKREEILSALRRMSRDAHGNLDRADTSAAARDSATAAAKQGKEQKKGTSDGKEKKPEVTRNLKGEKKVVIELAALKGKGYPAERPYDSRDRKDQDDERSRSRSEMVRDERRRDSDWVMS